VGGRQGKNGGQGSGRVEGKRQSNMNGGSSDRGRIPLLDSELQRHEKRGPLCKRSSEEGADQKRREKQGPNRNSSQKIKGQWPRWIVRGGSREKVCCENEDKEKRIRKEIRLLWLWVFKMTLKETVAAARLKKKKKK